MVVNTFLVNTVLQAALLYYGARLCLKEGLHPRVLIAFMLYQGQLQEHFIAEIDGVQSQNSQEHLVDINAHEAQMNHLEAQANHLQVSEDHHYIQPEA